MQSKPGELLVRMKAVDVNPLETYMRRGVYNTKFLGGVYGKILLTPLKLKRYHFCRLEAIRKKPYGD